MSFRFKQDVGGARRSLQAYHHFRFKHVISVHHEASWGGTEFFALKKKEWFSSERIFDQASGRPELFCGLHYFNPVQLMRLVEIVRTEHTTDATIDAAAAFVKKIGKTGVNCKDTPGFVVNRLLVPYMVQAQLMVERGDATPEDIDTAMRLGAGMWSSLLFYNVMCCGDEFS